MQINLGLGELRKTTTNQKSTHHLWHLINLLLLGWICFLFFNLKRWLEGHFNGLESLPGLLQQLWEDPAGALWQVRSRAELLEDPGDA